jgi:hypothetical protein
LHENISRHDPDFARVALDDENNAVRMEELIGVSSTVGAATLTIISRRKLGQVGSLSDGLPAVAKRTLKMDRSS